MTITQTNSAVQAIGACRRAPIPESRAKCMLGHNNNSPGGMTMVLQRLLALVLSAAATNAFAQAVAPAQTGFSAERPRLASAQMVVAANRFLGTLTPEQRTRATFALDDTTERTRFNFIPTETFPRKGLQLREMSEPQRKLAHELLKSGLSDRGYFTYTQIMALEDVLKLLEQPARLERDKEKYFVSVFGTPAEKGAWGLRFEGHHISLHYTILDGKSIASPTFAGTNPAEVRDGPEKGKRILGQQEDTGRALLMALDATQRATATISAVAPNEIVTTNQLDIKPLTPDGIKASAMTPAQRAALMQVLDAFVGLMTPEVAADRMARITAAGIGNIAFAWAGPTERGQKHYYRVQGPTFLIELDNTQNNGNHVHSIWRDFKDDFGRDLLREHIKASH
ncbi:MAG: DUF3500 domain-containing protein [Steroidobacteraceae bacterium]